MKCYVCRRRPPDRHVGSGMVCWKCQRKVDWAVEEFLANKFGGGSHGDVS